MLTFRCWYTAIAILLVPFALQAQKRNNIWFFGFRAGIDFNGPTPVNIPGGLASNFEGSAVISDRNTGALLFYTDGERAMNRNRQPMPGGTGLHGNSSSTQSSLIVPMPGDSMKYYLFTIDAAENNLANGLQYSIVDMRLDGGRGDIARKNVPLMAPAAEKVTGMLGCDGRYYWVIAHEWGSNAFRAYKITLNGISSPVISAVGIGHKAYQTYAVGYMKLSPNGRKLAVAITGANVTQLFDFDTRTGNITNPIDLPLPDTTFTYGVAFSPDNSLLYVSGFKNVIYQYDITSGDADAIRTSRFMLNSPTRNTSFGALQLGPDGRIYYVMNGQSSLGVIESPNVRGAGADFRPSGFDLGTASGSLGLPNMIEGDAHDVLKIQIDSARSICPGGTTQLHASGGTVYQWSPARGLSCADCPSPTASPTVTTTYTVNVYTDADCPAVDSVTVLVHQPADIDAGDDVAICRGDSATLAATAGAVYLWSPSDGLSCADCRSPRAMPATSTLYHVIVTDSGGCTATDSVRVTVLPSFTANAGPDAAICRGAAISLHASGGAAWQWTPATTLSCADCPDPVASPSATTTYHLAITSPEGCVATDSITVNVTSLPFVDAGNDAAICAGGNVGLHASDGTAWQWSPAAGLSCADCRSPLASPAITTTYHLLVTGANGCIGEDSLTVTVNPLPIAAAGRDTTICTGSSIALHAGIAGTYRWSPSAGLNCADCSDPIATPGETTTYILTVANAGGCTASDSVTLGVIIPPPIDAGSDTIICADGSAALHASGGGGYHWSPAAGLSCTDCSDPIATPSRTTVYIVRSATTTGCPAIDSVRITVLPREVIHAHIPRDLHLLPGTSIDVPVIVDDPAAITNGNSYTIRLAYRPGIIRVRDVITDRTASSGWMVDSRLDTIGRVTLRMTRPAGAITSISDTLLMFGLRVFVGDSIASELQFTLELGCASVDAIPGLVTLDSICGLSQRLIEPITGKYALRQNTPNPFSPSTSIEFSLGLDGPTRLIIVDERGNAVATLLDGPMPSGNYSVAWDASAIPSGLYYCRLSSGDWSATRVMLLVR
ncbi:MAG: Fibronectin type protein [Chlorobi bacterium]|nr:Fibronectin type protein [Chlorobiota bacterium]